MKQYVAGLDPGEKGSVVVIDMNRQIAHRQHFDDMTEEGLVSCLRLVATNFRPVVVKEIFIPAYGNSSAAFVAGRHHALIDLVCREQQLRKIEVRAVEWQAALLPKEHRNVFKVKYSALQKANELFEGVEFRVPLKTKLSKNPHEGLVDAALIAWHGVNLVANQIGEVSKSLAW